MYDSTKKYSDEYIDWDVTIGFCGYIGAEETVTVYAPIDADEEYLMNELCDMADEFLYVDTVYDLGDDEYEVVINFAGFMGVDETYTVHANDGDDAEAQAIEDATYDISIESFEPSK